MIDIKNNGRAWVPNPIHTDVQDSTASQNQAQVRKSNVDKFNEHIKLSRKYTQTTT